MARISTHVLDIARGEPAAGIEIQLYYGLALLKHTKTNADGRTDEPLVIPGSLKPGGYDLIFDAGEYFRAQGEKSFYEKITISFVVDDPEGNYHVPLLLSPFGYSTYRGS